MAKKLCNSCKKLWTGDCPIRVWGRTEKNEGENLDVAPLRDYCSRYERKKKD